MDAAPRKVGTVVADVAAGLAKGAMLVSGIATSVMSQDNASRFGHLTTYELGSPAHGSALETCGALGAFVVSTLAEGRLAKVRALNDMATKHLHTAGAITHGDSSKAAVRISYRSVDDVFEIVIDDKVFTASASAMNELLGAISAHGSAKLCAALVQEETEETRAQTWSVAVEFVDKSTTLRVFRSVTDDLVDVGIAKAGDDPATPYRIRLGVEQTYQFTRTWMRERDEANEKSSTVSGTPLLVLRIPATLAASAEGLCDMVSVASKSANVYAWFRPDRVLLLEN
jgi:hypothetical protein